MRNQFGFASDVAQRLQKASPGPWGHGTMMSSFIGPEGPGEPSSDSVQYLYPSSPGSVSNFYPYALRDKGDSWDYHWRNVYSLHDGKCIVGHYDYEDGGIASTPEDGDFIANSRTDLEITHGLLRNIAYFMDHQRFGADWVLERIHSQLAQYGYLHQKAPEGYTTDSNGKLISYEEINAKHEAEYADLETDLNAEIAALHADLKADAGLANAVLDVEVDTLILAEAEVPNEPESNPDPTPEEPSTLNEGGCRCSQGN